MFVLFKKMYLTPTKSKILAFGVLAIFIVACALRVYYMQYKSVANSDEILSIILSEYNEYSWSKPFDIDKIYTAAQMQEAILWNDPTLKGTLHDVARLWRDNRDSPHTNVYYSLLRLWHIGFVHTDLKQTLSRGVGLNFVFFWIFLCFCLSHLQTHIWQQFFDFIFSRAGIFKSNQHQ